MTDIVERLRKLAERERHYGSLPDTLDEAAAHIKQLEAALRDLIWYTNQLELTVYDPSDWPTEHDEVRNARAALGEERT
jgi:thiamine phosphate synthase YjbQ (UPF0047 family)